MKSKPLKLVVLFALLCLLIGAQICLAAEDDALIYADAVEAIRAGQTDFAFMHLRELLKYGPASVHYQDALFACGEYYFLNGAFNDAWIMFDKLIKKYPRAESLPFVVGYLFRFTPSPGMDMDELRKKLVEFRRLSLVFSEFKGYTYISLLGVRYEARYYIDKVEIYINGEIFQKIFF
ncbi:MAG: hypothetical protein KJ893_00770 [Candidatus Omnitrophica bacterium]|nr:hypothetical protein [Candidatus Omnitrophota bacterium]MBU4479564.1 hypothetical protein [Candidatus Omnitrophota bacterium]MCG2704425.1 hypothetical protein [Candidatus Omnitrophota bacterium]